MRSRAVRRRAHPPLLPALGGCPLSARRRRSTGQPDPAGDLPRGLRRPGVPAAVRHLPALHRRRRAGPRGADRAGLPAHLLAAAVGDDLRHRSPAVAARRPAAVRAGRPAPPAPGAHRHRRRPGGAPGADGDPRHAAAGPARPALPGVALRAAVRVRALGAHGRRARGRPVRRRHLADQHHACSSPRSSASWPPGRWSPCSTRRGAAHRRRDVRRLRRVALGGLQAPAGAAGRGRRGPALPVAGHRDGLRFIGRTPRLLAIVGVLWLGTLFAYASEGVAAPLVDELGQGRRPSGSCWRPTRSA